MTTKDPIPAARPAMTGTSLELVVCEFSTLSMFVELGLEELELELEGWIITGDTCVDVLPASTVVDDVDRVKEAKEVFDEFEEDPWMKTN